MTRFSSPPPQSSPGAHAQNGHAPHQPQHQPGPSVHLPNSQGRPAAPGGPQSYPHGTHIEPDLSGWPSQGAAPRTGGRPAAGHAYGDAQAVAAADPYAALRPDGFGYGQPPKPVQDDYGLAGYSPPQPQLQPAVNGYGRAPQSPAPPQHAAAPGYGAQADPYGAGLGYAPAGGHQAPAYAPAPPPAQGQGYGANGHGYAAPPPPASYGNGYAAAPQPAGGYDDPWGVQGQAGQHASGAGQSLSLDARDYGYDYGAPDHHGGQPQWGGETYAEPAFEPGFGHGGGQGHGGAPAMGQHGYAGAPQGNGAFDQSYAEDEAAYEDEPRGGGWKKVVALVACTVLIGGVLTVAYSSIMSPNTGEPTPLVKGAQGPAKVKPSDPGGKQFAHADSKIMGRLGEGGEESDVSGVRKVPVITVGRDGSIQPPETSGATPQETRAVVAVPGLTVIDGLDTPSGGPSPTRPVAPKAEQASPPVQMVTANPSERPVVVSPPAKQAKAEAKPLVDTAREETAALPARAEAAPAPKKQKVAAVDASPAAGPKPTGAGYVAVLASVPASGSSRMDALAQFADMQQRYGAILSNKTPDIREANLGERGTYHRLMVGPPASRDSANAICAQLKAQGYSGCWITAY